MDVSTASAYIYAKASGMLANSFVGSRTVKLFDARSVADLWLMLFKTEVPLVPENMLARLTEEKAEAVFIADFMKLLNAFDEPDPVALQLLRFYDYLNIKQIASALLMKQPDMPTIVDIGRYSMLDYAKWPKLADITRDSSISWHTDIPNRSEQKDIDARLDIQYSKELWLATQKIRNSEKEPVKKIIKDYIVFQNIVWAIRLMSYYGLHSDDIAKQLVFEDEKAGQTDVLAGPALSVLDKHPDDWADWADWT
ncbi:MAG: V-type ATPase subunit, partial [Spirochaetales bacterium]